MASVDWNAQLAQYIRMGANPDLTAGPLLAALGSACQSAVEQEIGRTLDTKTYTEAYDGNDRRTLFLRHDPVVSLTSVSIYGTALTVANTVPTYPPAIATIEPSRQGILLTGENTFTGGTQNVLVTYGAGLSDIDTDQPPADLVFAITYWASLLFKGRDRVGENSRTVGDQLSTFTMTMPPDVRQMVAHYRRVWFR